MLSMKQPLFAPVLIILLLFCIGTAQADEPLKIGVLYWSMNIPGQVAMRKGLEAEVRKINQAAAKTGKPQVQLLPQVAGDGSQGITRQISQMREMVRQKPAVIIVQPTDNAALAEPLREANKAGIPVVAYDQYISGGSLAAYITSDNYQAGFLDGEYIASRFTDKKTLSLILVDYPNISSTVERVNGFLDALTKYNQHYRLIKTYQAVEPVGGRKAAEAILKDFPTKGSIDIIFMVNDGGGLAIVGQLAKAGRSEIVVATVDGDPASVDNIRRKRLTVINAAQFCGPLGGQAMKAAYTLATGGKVAHHQLIPVFPITRETISQYPGWLGPIPKAFKKPWSAQTPRWEGTIQNVLQ
jgi:ribose transport system substrate-binding protein